MKKTILISSMVIVSSFLLVGFINNSAKISARTEEYAIVDVVEYGKKKIIRVTIGEEPAQEKQWEKEKTEIAGDFTPVMKELHALNAKGFELLNTSLTYSVPSSSSGHSSSGVPEYVFVLRRKL